jgi:2-methylisocitrate lyase-like PEP mutase family enzyme
MAKDDDRSERFRALHREGCFVMPNAFDAGSARLLTTLGFPALATTSSGFAATLGRLDMTVGRDEVVEHVRALTAVTHLPVNVDGERCFAETPAGVAETVARFAAAGAAGCSIEDWDPAAGRIDPLGGATERVAAAAGAARAAGLVLTARCENLLRGVDDLDDTIARLVAYRDAGAEVVYAPALVDPEQIRTVVEAVGVPVNVLLLPGGPTVPELGAAGVRRVSVGGALNAVALGAVVAAARSLLADGVIDPALPRLDRALAREAFG